MGLYPGEIECSLCGKRHGAYFFSLDFSSASGEYGRCVARSLLLGVLSTKAGKPPQKKISIPDPNHLSTLNPGRKISVRAPVREYVDPYKPPTLSDLFSKSNREADDG